MDGLITLNIVGAQTVSRAGSNLYHRLLVMNTGCRSLEHTIVIASRHNKMSPAAQIAFGILGYIAPGVCFTKRDLVSQCVLQGEVLDIHARFRDQPFIHQHGGNVARAGTR